MAHTHKNTTPKKSKMRERRMKIARRIGKAKAKDAWRLASISRKMLQAHVNVASFAEVLAEARRKRIAQTFVRKSRQQYHEAISLALALYYAAQAADDPNAALEKLVKETGQRITKSTTAAQIVVRVVIDYGATEEERRANRKIVSRDAAAVDHLAEHGISPDRVVELGMKKGEGLEAWGRATPQRNSKPARPKALAAKKPRSDPGANVEDLWSVPRANANEFEDEREEKHELKRISAVPEELIEHIKEIAKTGPLICCADDDDATVWAVISVRLEGLDSQADPERAREMLIDALQEYVERLMA